MKKSNVSMKKKRIILYLDPPIYDEISGMASSKGIPLSTYIRSILTDHIARRGRAEDSPELRNLISRRTEIEKREHEALESMRQILGEISSIIRERPDLVDRRHYSDILGQITSALSTKPMTMRELVKVTSIPETQILIVLSSLMDSGRIFLDPDYRYRLRRG